MKPMTPEAHLAAAYSAADHVRVNPHDVPADEHYAWLVQWHATMALAESFRPVQLKPWRQS